MGNSRSQPVKPNTPNISLPYDVQSSFQANLRMTQSPPLPPEINLPASIPIRPNRRSVEYKTPISGSLNSSGSVYGYAPASLSSISESGDYDLFPNSPRHLSSYSSESNEYQGINSRPRGGSMIQLRTRSIQHNKRYSGSFVGTRYRSNSIEEEFPYVSIRKLSSEI